MRLWVCCSVAIVAASMAAPAQTRKPVPLFDGKTFDGWQGDTAKTWRIQEGAIVGGSLTERVPQNDFLCTTRSYGDFVLRLSFKLLGSDGFINGGVQFRSQRATKPANEMIGYQADIGAKYWGALYDETRRNRILAEPDPAMVATLIKLNDWNEYEIRAEGPRIRLTLNGRQTVDYTETDATIPRAGLIGFQVHGGGKAEVHYRSITIEELK